ncbi:MAG: hypothetical protein ACK55Z_10410, partial [bacterium]
MAPSSFSSTTSGGPNQARAAAGGSARSCGSAPGSRVRSGMRGKGGGLTARDRSRRGRRRRTRCARGPGAAA